MPTVMALFQQTHETERALAELSLNGFGQKDVSVVIFSANPTPKPGKPGLIGWLSRGGFLGDTIDQHDGISVMDGVGVGAAIGGLVGLSLGSQWRFGPVATGTGLMLLGGLIGYLLDRLIPEKRRDQFETASISGLLLVSVTTLYAERAEAAKRVLEGCMASQVAVLPERDAPLPERKRGS